MKKVNKIILVLMSKMMISCKKASYLSSKQLDTRLNIFEKLNLKFHLLGCKYCLAFQQQVGMIDKGLKNVNGKIYEDFKLTEQDKGLITNRLHEEFHKLKIDHTKL